MNLMNQKADNSFIALVKRSTDAGEGWKEVNPRLSKLVTEKVAETPDLFETKTEGDKLFVRLSIEGAIVAKYL